MFAARSCHASNACLDEHTLQLGFLTLVPLSAAANAFDFAHTHTLTDAVACTGNVQRVEAVGPVGCVQLQPKQLWHSIFGDELQTHISMHTRAHKGTQGHSVACTQRHTT
jgi:hypothetical protein